MSWAFMADLAHDISGGAFAILALLVMFGVAMLLQYWVLPRMMGWIAKWEP